MNVVIIDDEVNSRELLQTMLESYCEGVQVMGMAENVASGIGLIRQVAPDLVFLDIEMPGGDGFAVLDAFPEPQFQVIFVTGYPDTDFAAYALAALAWLQKPVDLAELQATLSQSDLLPPTHKTQLEWIAGTRERTPEELLLPVGDGYERIPFADIAYLAAHRSYSAFHLRNGTERLASLPLGHYEKLLPQNLFFRVHKSYLVNAAMVTGFEGGRGGMLFLKNDEKLPIAARRKTDFSRFIRNFGIGS